jgi:hypothetical protein
MAKDSSEVSHSSGSLYTSLMKIKGGQPAIRLPQKDLKVIEAFRLGTLHHHQTNWM